MLFHRKLCLIQIFLPSTWATTSIFHFKWVLPFPIKIHSIKIFTRATPGISLVVHKSARYHPGPVTYLRKILTRGPRRLFFKRWKNSRFETQLIIVVFAAQPFMKVSPLFVCGDLYLLLHRQTACTVMLSLTGIYVTCDQFMVLVIEYKKQ